MNTLNNTLSIRDLLARKVPQLEIAGSYRFDDIPSRDEIACQWQVHRGDIGIALRGEITGVLLGECARCLSAFDIPFNLAFHEKLVFSRFAGELEGSDNGGELSALDDSFCETIDEDSVVDLADLVRQYLVMMLSEYPCCGQADCQYPVMSTGAEG